MYIITFYNNPYTYPDYGAITQVGTSFEVTGVDIDDSSGSLRTDKLTFPQRFSVNYIKIEREGVTLYAYITAIERLTGAHGVLISFKVDAFRTFRNTVNFGTQFVVRQPESSWDYDPLLRGATGEFADISTTRYNFDNPIYRILVVQIMRPDNDTVAAPTPIQPSPYVFYFKQYNINNPETDADINALMNVIRDSSRPTNLASIYSIPVFSSGGMSATLSGIPLIIGGSVTTVGSNFFRLSGGSWPAAVRKFTDPFTFTDKSILRTNHQVSVLIPDAGIINVPDELLFKENLRVRQDIDIYTGASNYMLVYDGVDITPSSVRGGGLAAIPIAYDAQQQLLAANRYNIGTSVLGDVASIGLGIAGLAGAPATGGISGMVGGGMIAKGVVGLVSTFGSIQTATEQQVNPPAFLGSALIPNFNQCAFLVVAKGKQTNAAIVNQRFGYPCNQVKTVTIPSSGYLQTQDCNVTGNVPTWARVEINTLLDQGLRVL